MGQNRKSVTATTMSAVGVRERTLRVGSPHGHAFLAASYAHAGAAEEARAAATQLVGIAQSEMGKVGAPILGNWLEFLSERFPFKGPGDLDHLLDGLRKAGLSA